MLWVCYGDVYGSGGKSTRTEVYEYEMTLRAPRLRPLLGAMLLIASGPFLAFGAEALVQKTTVASTNIYDQYPLVNTLEPEKWQGEYIQFTSDMPPNGDKDSLKPFSAWLGAPIRIDNEFDGPHDPLDPPAEKYEGRNKAWVPTYRELAGKRAQIVSYSPRSEEGRFLIVARIVGSKQLYWTYAKDNVIQGVSFERDVEAARRKLVGKPLWYCRDLLKVEGKKLVDPYSVVGLPRYTKVIVEDVQYSPMYYTPVRVVVKVPSGERCYVDVKVSQTNVWNPDITTSYFERNFLLSDPKEAHPFTPAIWSAIGAGKATKGMPPLAVCYALGRPSDIKKPASKNDGDLMYVYMFYEESGESFADFVRNVYFRQGQAIRVEKHLVRQY